MTAVKQAIIQTGGKQYLVAVNDVIDVELLGKEVGSKVSFDQVLFLKDGSALKIGAPTVEGAAVSGTLLEEVKGPKLDVFKYKRRKRFRKKKGHRQSYSRVLIEAISL